MSGLLIGELASLAGVTAPTIRYYESIGLLPSPGRTASGYRRYAAAAVDDLRFIRKAQAIGFSLGEIGEILRLSRAGQAPCERVVSLGHQHLAAIDERLRRLQLFRDQFAVELDRWNHRHDDGEPATHTRRCQLIEDAPDVSDIALHPERTRDRAPRRQS